MNRCGHAHLASNFPLNVTVPKSEGSPATQLQIARLGYCHSPTNLSFLVQSILANRQANQHTALGHMMYGFFLWPFTLINSLLFAAGICAWAVWASRQRNAQSDLVERLIGKKSTAWLKHVELQLRRRELRCSAAGIVPKYSIAQMKRP